LQPAGGGRYEDFLCKIFLAIFDLWEELSKMSRESRQRLRGEAKRREMRLAYKKKLRWVLLPLTMALVAGSAFTWINLHPKPKENVADAAHASTKPGTLRELLALPPEQLDKVDVGLMSLLCAEGLPGSENLDVEACLEKLDDLATKAKFDTDRHFYRFREHPEQFRNSLGYYRVMMLGGVLVQDLGIQYKPDLVEYLKEGNAPTYGVFNSDSKNVFIHGLLNGSHYGTCASMPVLLAAVAHRLGYPVHLAGTKLHIYARYEDNNGKHFNIEPTVTEGFLTPTDEDYKTGQFACTDEEIKGYGWLRPYSNQEILSHMLFHRAVCLGMAKRYEEARDMALKTASYSPDTPLLRKHFQMLLEQIKNAPLGDKIDDWRKQIDSWEIPKGPRDFYFGNRKVQIRYFVGFCPDAEASQRAVDDLKNELAEYAHQMTLANPAPEFLDTGQNSLSLENIKTGQSVKIPDECLPPPLNHGNTPRDYFHAIKDLDLSDEGVVVDALWQHYHDITTDWSNQPPQLPQHGRAWDRFSSSLISR
jgi:hypothetical protein